MAGPMEVEGQPELTEDEKEVSRVLEDPGQWVRRLYWPDSLGDREYEAMWRWQARAILAYRVAREEVQAPQVEKVRAWGTIAVPEGSPAVMPFSQTTGWVEVTEHGALALYGRGPRDPEDGTLLLLFDCGDKDLFVRVMTDADSLRRVRESVEREVRQRLAREK